MKQVDKMRELFRKHQGDEERCVADYASAERRGAVRRKSNTHGLSADDYARRLYYDGVRKGWIEE